MQFFRLTRNERFGLVGVLVIFIAIFVFKYFDSKVHYEIKQSSVRHSNEIKQSKLRKQIFQEVQNKSERQSQTEIKVFEKFNPNRVNANYWMKIGFDSKLANRLEKFIKSGFELKNITDLKKVYGMKKEWVLMISDSVVFNSYLIDINVANAESFESINGIGTKIANRIIKFRSSLGGFYSVNQLEDVYGIDSTILAENLDKFKLITSHQKIKINKVGLNNMIKHPLINVFQGEEIIKIRSIYGTVDSIKVRNIFTIKEWSEIKNYLEWEN